MSKRIRGRAAQYLDAFNVSPTDIDSVLDAMILEDREAKRERRRAINRKSALDRRARQKAERRARVERSLIARREARGAAARDRAVSERMKGKGGTQPGDGIASWFDRALIAMAPGLWYRTQELKAALPGIAGTITRMRQKGWVERREIEGQRAPVYRLTPYGVEVRAKKEKRVAERLRALGLSEVQQDIPKQYPGAGVAQGAEG